MKKLIYFFLALLASLGAYAQELIESGQDQSLIIRDTRSGVNWNYIEWQFSNHTRDWVLGRHIGTGYFTLFRDGVNEVLTVDNAGKVGIGTTAPYEKLAVSGGEFSLHGSGLDGSTLQRFVLYSNTTYGLYFDAPRDASGNRLPIEFNWRGGGQSPLRITGNGNVGIGVNTPTAKLEVDGTIISEEIKVQVVNGPDYVFSPDYELRTLEETKTYIEENQHLPEIPSAAEMEANGVALGEMNMLLLKKIEELTLHVIEQQKVNEAQALKIENLEKRCSN